MKKLIIKSVIFLIILSGIIYKIDNYFVKNQSAFIKHHFFYEKEKKSLDVLIFGDSHTYCGISSDIIKAKTGLNTFNYGLAGLNFNEIYYNLLEALAYQKPKLVIIECYPLVGIGQEKKYLNDKGLLNRNYSFSLEGKKLGLTKLKEAKLSIPDYNFLKTFNIFKYHENWSNLKEVSKVLNTYTNKSDFPPFKDSAKDVVFMSDQIAKNFEDKTFKDSIYLSEDHKKLIHKIIDLSKEKDFKLLFVTVPFYEKFYSKTKSNFDKVQKEIANTLKIDSTIKILDLNPKMTLDKSNFIGGNIKSYNYKNQHLNYKGNIKVSNIISNYINKNYKINKRANSTIGLHDAFYNYKADSDGFEGGILTNKKEAYSKTIVSDVSFYNSIATNLIKNNSIKFNNEFENPVWINKGIAITPNTMLAPDGELTADKIIGTGNKDGYVVQGFPYKTGLFKWSVWLKGSGLTRLRLQENGGDYTNYATYNIKLTPNWKRYSLLVSKDKDKNGIRAAISGIQSSDIIYTWGAKLREITDSKEKASFEKEKNTILITEKQNKVEFNGWMHIENVIIKDKFIALKKDNEFNYISLKHQLKTIKKEQVNNSFKESKHTYLFQIPKDILEKGTYEIFNIARSDTNKFYIKKSKKSIIIK